MARTLRRLAARSRAFGAAIGGRPPSGEVAVSYGSVRAPGPDEHAVGGVIKLQHLQRVYPDRPYRFNVLYLVSSRLPEGAPELAQAARRKGARIVINQNGVAYAAWHGPGWEQVNAPMAALLASADHVLYQSRFCREAANLFLGTASAPSEILFNPVNTRAFCPAAARPQRPLTLMLGGAQEASYRVETAVCTLARVRHSVSDAELIVTGRLRWTDDASARRDVEAMAAECGVAGAVRLTGPYTQQEAPELFRQADILLHTKYQDPCPSVVIEALACGLPVVYSATGGVPELVGDEAGIGVPSEASWDRIVPPDPDALAHAVIAVASARERYAEAARRRAVERFDVQPWLRRHRDLFMQLAAGHA